MTILTPGTYEVTLRRRFDAPRRLVWQAWTDPVHLAKWWGPTTMTNPVCELDVRVGGAWRVTMRSPEGVDYPIIGVYREVVAPERLVMTCNVEGHPKDWHDLLKQHRGDAPGKLATDLMFVVTFAEEDGKTMLTVVTCFPTAADRDAYVTTGMEGGWNESFDKLAALLARGG